MFHDGVVERAPLEVAVALHDEDVGAANRLGEPAVGLAIRKLAQVRLGDFDAEVRCDFVSEFGVVATREEVQPLCGYRFH